MVSKLHYYKALVSPIDIGTIVGKIPIILPSLPPFKKLGGLSDEMWLNGLHNYKRSNFDVQEVNPLFLH